MKPEFSVVLQTPALSFRVNSEVVGVNEELQAISAWISSRKSEGNTESPKSAFPQIPLEAGSKSE